MISLKDKVVIITGGGRGIGFGLSTAFAKAGAKLVITGRTESTLLSAKEKLENAYHCEVLTVTADGADEAAIQNVIDKTVEKFGDCIVNDISAGELDPTMIETVAELQLPYIAMHMRGTPATMQEMTSYGNIVEEVREYFVRKIEQLRLAGIGDIVIDAGFGFAKSLDQNYELMRGLHRLTDLGAPLLVGISRKSMIYKLLGCTPDKALNGTTALHLEALRQGAKILRVHDTREAKEVITIFNKLNKTE